MKTRIVMLSAVTRTDRHTAMTEVNDAVLTSGGWVEGHTLLSNIATVFRLEISAEGLEAFLARLPGIGIRLDEDSLEAARKVAGLSGDRSVERPVSLNLTFIHDEPDLRRTVPAVPG